MRKGIWMPVIYKGSTAFLCFQSMWAISFSTHASPTPEVGIQASLLFNPAKATHKTFT
jgi:hypothetical protein